MDTDAGGWRAGAEAPPARAVAAWAGGTVLVVAGILALVAWRPDLRDAILAEDRLVEWASVLACYAAFAVGVLRARGPEGRDLLLTAVAWAALVAGLDELSFGERLLGWEPPEVMGTRLDAVHDLLRIAKTGIAGVSGNPYLLAGAIGAAVLAASLLAGAGMVRRGARVRLGPEAALLVLALALAGAAQVADLKLQLLGARTLARLGAEEAMELGGALALLGFAVLRGPGRGGAGRRRNTVPFPARTH